jgi:ribosomal protein S27E
VKDGLTITVRPASRWVDVVCPNCGRSRPYDTPASEAHTRLDCTTCHRSWEVVIEAYGERVHIGREIVR